VDLTGQNQQGFKKKRSTGTLSLDLHSKTARALDDDKYVMVASLDLCSAFDIVNTDLLIKGFSSWLAKCDSEADLFM
jgi:hypothetical protein